MVSTLEGAVGGRRGQEGWLVGVSHDHTEKCLMSCDVFGRAINTHTDVMAVKVEQRDDRAQRVVASS